MKTSKFNQCFEEYLTTNIQNEHQDHSNAKFLQLFDKRINTGLAFWNMQHLKPLLLPQIAHLFPSCNPKQGPATAAGHFIQMFGNGATWQICQIIHKIYSYTEFVEAKLDLPFVLKERLPQKENKHHNVNYPVSADDCLK